MAAPSMAVVGIDIGTQSLVISQARRGGFDIILNEASKRQTPCLVSFNGNERFLGEAAVTQVRTNMANTITEMKRYIGRKYSEAGVTSELEAFANFEAVDLGNDELGVEVSYTGDSKRFSMTQVHAMLLTKARQIVALNNPGMKDVEAVITVPAWYTHAERRAVQASAAIAKISVLRLINEGTAASLSYGIFKAAKKEFAEGKDTPVMFLDMGASTFTATVSTFTNTSLRVLSTVSDPTIGGRDLDVAIAKYFAAEHKAKTGSDPWKSAKARIKLLIAAEKAKISISPHGVNSTPVSVECLYEDRDLSATLTEEKLVELMMPTVQAKVARVIAKAMEQADIRTVADLSAVELVGGSCRPRLVKRAAAIALCLPIDEATGHGLSQSMNLDETNARGAALAAASLSTVFRVKPYEVVDVVTYPVKAVYDAAGCDDMEEDGVSALAGSTLLFKAGDRVPADKALTKRMTFKRTADFDVSLAYDIPADLAFMWPSGSSPAVGTYTVKLPADAGVPGAKARLDLQHDRNGCVAAVYVEVLKPIEESSPDASPPAAPGDVEMKAGEESAGEGPKKRKMKRVDASVVPAAGSPWYLHAMSPAALTAAINAEATMQAADAEIHATQDMRNSLEAYIYSARSSMGDSSASSFTTPAEREAGEASLSDMEGWLYGDGFEADKATYEGKLKALQALCEPIFARKWEAENRYAAVTSLAETIAQFRDVEQNKTGKHGHLSDSDKDTLRAATAEAESWMKTKQGEQSNLESYQEPALRVRDINECRDKLVKELTPIANKKAPVPVVPVAAPVPAASPTPAPSQGVDNAPMPTDDDAPMA